MSRVNSENFTCSEQEPTINTSCNDKVIIGDFSNGGVINGFNLKNKIVFIKENIIFIEVGKTAKKMLD